MPRRMRVQGVQVLVASAVVAVVLAIGLPVAVQKLQGDFRASRGGGSPLPSHTAGPSVFRFYQENPNTLDPTLASDSYASCVIAQIYSPLVGLTSDLEPTPQVAESWTISHDGLRYVFHIRPGVRFHNGREVTARDFEYSLTRVFREPFRTNGLAANYLDAIVGVPEFTSGKAKRIRGIRVLDPRRLEITLARPYSSLLTALALDQTSAVPREIADLGQQALERHPVGTGPFRFVRRDARQVVLAGNREYFMGSPGIDTLIFYTPRGDVTAQGADALLEGHATLSQLPVTRIEEFRARPGIAVLRWNDLSLAFIGMNTRMRPLNDPRVRQAIALAMDRQGMLNARPEGKSIATGILPPGLPGYAPAQKAYMRDVSAAQALLAKAGYNRRHPLPPLTLWKSSSSANARAADTVMVRSLAEAGITVTLRYETWGMLDNMITGRRAPLFALSWVADIPDPDTFLRALFYSRSSTNYFGFSSHVVDSLLDRARDSADPDERMAAYRRAEETILKMAPFVPLYHTASFIGIRDDVAGLEMNPLGISTLQMEKLRFTEPEHDDGRRVTR
ncbi:MAG TPA: ABC transporter substrate-binding protein [Candidatus Limnocylindrales bacterium]|nr:ABC transporter substrate-binding protein [Candidatus Limnocylindrales bacterium]